MTMAQLRHSLAFDLFMLLQWLLIRPRYRRQSKKAHSRPPSKPINTTAAIGFRVPIKTAVGAQLASARKGGKGPILIGALSLLLLVAVTARANARTPKVGLVIEIASPSSALSLAGLRTNDIILQWQPLLSEAKTPWQPDSAFSWSWFADELLPRGPVKVTYEREGLTLEAIVFSGPIAARSHPPLADEHLFLYSRINRLISNNSAREATLLCEELIESLYNSSPDTLSWASHLTATVYARAGELNKAIAWNFKALELATNSLAEIYIWQSMGIAYQEAGMTRDAESSYQRALSISKANLAGRLIETTSLRALYLLYWWSRDLGNVRRYLSLEIAILEQHAPQSLQLANSWEMLGVLSSRAGDQNQARTYHNNALTIRHIAAPDGRDVARSFINLGSLAVFEEDYSKAKSYFILALDVLKRTDPQSPELAPTYSNMGRVEAALGNLDEAEKMYRTSLAHTAADEMERFSTLKSLSHLARKRGDLIQSEEWSRQAIAAIETKAPLSREMSDALASLASIQFEIGNLERAKDLFESAASINQKLNSDELALTIGLNNIASVLYRSGNYTEAESLWTKTLNILERRLPGSLSTARALHNLGEARKARSDFEAALRFFRAALDIEKKAAPFSAQTVTTLWQLGVSLRELSRHEEALIAQNDAVTISQQVPLAESIQAQALYEQSITLKRLGKSDKALQSLRAAVGLIETQADRIIGTDDNRIQFRSRFSHYYRDYIHTLIAHGKETDAFEAQELFLARSLASLFAERDLVDRDAPAHLEASRIRLAAKYDAIQESLAKAYDANDGARVEELRKALREVRDQQSQLISLLRHSSPHLSNLRHPIPLTVAGAQKTLDAGLLALSFNVNTDSSILFALMSDGTFRVHRINIAKEELRRRISRFINLITERPLSLRREALHILASMLYDLLLAPVADLLNRSERILIIPDGPLHELPFAALVKSESTSLKGNNSEFFGEYRPFHIASSLTTNNLRRSFHTGRPAAIGENLVAFGDPEYRGTHDEGLIDDPYARAAFGAASFAPLPWSRVEVQRIAGLFPGRAKTFLGNNATEKAAKFALSTGSYRFVHFAGHGYLDDEIPRNSAIALTVPRIFEYGSENGLLQAWEILEQLHLNVDLIVLSTCESGLGKEMGGEGLIGLTRAFQYAGARSIMASLWKISDRTTSEFMARFYRRLKAGIAKDEALRATQKEFIHETIKINDEKGEPVALSTSDPYYWAPFQIYGEWK